jgi:hypothetical protein
MSELGFYTLCSGLALAFVGLWVWALIRSPKPIRKRGENLLSYEIVEKPFLECEGQTVQDGPTRLPEAAHGREEVLSLPK